MKIVDGEVGAEGSGTITATLNGITGNISWRSNATGVATVSGNGNSATVTAVGAGTAEITATCGEHSAKCNVTVTSVTTAEVTFNANGGEFSDSTTEKTVNGYTGEEKELPEKPTRSGYKFIGWYNSATGRTKVYEENAITGTLSSTGTVYAHWISMPEYTEMGTATAGNYSTLTTYWEYLYSDSSNIYLIHKDYLPNQYVYLPTGIAKVSGSDYKIKSTSSRTTLVNYLTTTSNWENISGAIARDLNTMTGTSNYSTSNVITKGGPTLPQVQTVLNDTTHKVGYVESGTTTVYSDETKTTTIGAMSSNVSATGWVYCSNWSSNTSTFSIALGGYFTTAQGSSLYTSDIANIMDKAFGYWLARSFCG